MKKTTSTALTVVAAVGALAGLGIVAYVAMVVWTFTAASGCPRDVEESNEACASLARRATVSIRCDAYGSTPEWGGCEDRTRVTLSWSDGAAVGGLSRTANRGARDGAPSPVWSCSNGEFTLSIDPRSATAGTEPHAADAFRQACGALIGAR